MQVFICVDATVTEDKALYSWQFAAKGLENWENTGNDKEIWQSEKGGPWTRQISKISKFHFSENSMKENPLTLASQFMFSLM